jgi:predicted transglutaminase-like cysteine proteinase
LQRLGMIAKRLVLAPLAFIATLASAQVIADLGFTTKISAGLVAEYMRRFGNPVPDRFARWSGFAKAQKTSGQVRALEATRGRELDAMQLVNDAVNDQMRWVDDRKHWGAEDYWATPAESYGSAAGDCEDFSIAKYYLLKELGVPLERLRITYVRALKLGGQAHMVLAYYATPGAEPLILDNIDARVRPASQRTDLEPVYTFNDDEVQIRGASRGKPSQIRAWLTLQEHLTAETRM